MEVPRRRLRKSITVIPQEPFLLDGSVRENADVSGKRTDEEIWAALEAVQVNLRSIMVFLWTLF